MWTVVLYVGMYVDCGSVCRSLGMENTQTRAGYSFLWTIM